MENAQITSITKVAYEMGESVMYACSQNFAINGNGTIICQGYGQWSSPLPVCVAQSPSVGGNDRQLSQNNVKCTSPPEIENGYVMFNSTAVGAVALYTCLDEYRVSGTPTASCDETGQWSVAPSCVFKGCGSIPAIPNAQLLSGWSSDVGASLVYRCYNGYRLAWGNGTVTCGSDGRWSRLPVCQGFHFKAFALFSICYLFA